MKRSLLVVMTILLFAICLFANGAPAQAGCMPDIKANGSDAPIAISQGDPLNVSIQFDPGTEAGKQGDWWVAAYTPSGFYYLSLSALSWVKSSGELPPIFGGPLFALPQIPLGSVPGLPTAAGKYYFFFAVDTKKNNVIDFNKLCMDLVEVRVTAPSTDSEAPTVPTGLTATVISKNQINLSWNSSTDDTGVEGYNIYRNGVLLDTKLATVSTATVVMETQGIEDYTATISDVPIVAAVVTYSDTGLTPSTSYCYKVSAYDAAANESPRSAQICATTFDASGGCGSGLPLVISDLQLPATAASGSMVTGSVAFSGDYDAIGTPVVGLYFPYGMGGAMTYITAPGPTKDGCRINFYGRISDLSYYVGTTVNVHARVLDWDLPYTTTRWFEQAVSNETSTPVQITP